jgi:hypothetical protein
MYCEVNKDIVCIYPLACADFGCAFKFNVKQLLINQIKKCIKVEKEGTAITKVPYCNHEDIVE